MSEQAERLRDPAAEEKERLSFILLQHVYSLACEGDGLLVPTKIAADLALPPDQVVQLIAHLTYEGFLDWEGTGRPVGITQKAIDYIDRLALRRRSLRLPCPDVAPAPEPAFSYARQGYNGTG
jgi:hypothetical protein